MLWVELSINLTDNFLAENYQFLFFFFSYSFFSYSVIWLLNVVLLQKLNYFCCLDPCSACGREHSLNLLASCMHAINNSKPLCSLLSNQLCKPKRMSNSVKAKIHFPELIYHVTAGMIESGLCFCLQVTTPSLKPLPLMTPPTTSSHTSSLLRRPLCTAPPAVWTPHSTSLACMEALRWAWRTSGGRLIQTAQLTKAFLQLKKWVGHLVPPLTSLRNCIHNTPVRWVSSHTA